MTMSLSTFSKVLLGIAIVIAAVVAGTFHWWMAFLVFWAGVAALLLLIYAESRTYGGATSSFEANDSQELPSSRRGCQKLVLDDMERLEQDLATHPSNKRLVGNTFHHPE